jgi:tetraacyldisaccharide-1-P 4'-kinase
LEKHPNAKLLTTEKDAVKLRRSKRVPQIVRERMFYQPLRVEFLEGSDPDFFSTLKDDLDGKIHLGDLKINSDENN